MPKEVLPMDDGGKAKTVNIDFSNVRRTSFLPDSFTDKTSGHKVVNTSHEPHEVFMYINTAHNQERPLKKFCTNSKYLGQWNKLGIAGKGIYKYPHGVIYDGYFNKNGECHGSGILIYPNGQKIEGTWKNGKLGNDTSFVTRGGVTMSKNYCLYPDRRFQVEFENDFNPAGLEYLTDEEPPPRTIPKDCYDVVEGFYDPRVKTVYKYLKPENKRMRSRKSSVFGKETEKSPQITNATRSELHLRELLHRDTCERRKVVFWIPSGGQEQWIINNCRKAWDTATRYRPDLYEQWTDGTTANCGLTNVDQPKLSVSTNSDNVVSILEMLNLTDQKSQAKTTGLMSFIQKQNPEALKIMTDIFLSKQSDAITAAAAAAKESHSSENSEPNR